MCQFLNQLFQFIGDFGVEFSGSNGKGHYLPVLKKIEILLEVWSMPREQVVKHHAQRI
jgi:hypothetical protein